MWGGVLFSESAPDFSFVFDLLLGALDEGGGFGEGVRVVGEELVLLYFAVLEGTNRPTAKLEGTFCEGWF